LEPEKRVVIRRWGELEPEKRVVIRRWQESEPEKPVVIRRWEASPDNEKARQDAGRCEIREAASQTGGMTLI
jgi:hypothetical protein